MSPIQSFFFSAASVLGFAIISTSALATGGGTDAGSYRLNGPVLQGPVLQGPVLQGPVLQGPSTGPVRLGQPVAVTLAGGRKLQLK